MEQIYFDNSATTKVCAPAAKAAFEAMTDAFGNPSSLHGVGLRAEQTVEAARKALAGALGCGAREVVFTSGATESNNLAILGAARAARRRGNKIVISAVEHASVLQPAAALEKEGFCVVRISPRPDGTFAAADFAAAADDDTVLVSCMHVNNETGAILPVGEIMRAVKQKRPDVLCHIDAVQGFLKLPVSYAKLPVDLVSVSGHKVYAPKGVGALYLKQGVRILPLFFGGGQENLRRPGTESVPLIAAFGAAAALCLKERDRNLARYADLNARLRERLGGLDYITVHSPQNGAPYILNFSVRGIRSEIMLHFLEQRGIYVSSGSACAKGEASHVLKAMGVPVPLADTAIRVSLGRENTGEEIDRLAAAIREADAQLIHS